MSTPTPFGPSRFRSSWRGLLFSVALISGPLSCKQDTRSRDCVADQGALQSLLEQDRQVAAQLREADRLAKNHKGPEAANLVETRATHGTDQVISRVKAYRARTRWGVERTQELLSLTEQRRAGMSGYAAAIRGGDSQQMVEALSLQLEVERRAVRLEQTLRAPPPTASGQCDPP